MLIIDEINRGNVSQIFGELITLIEDNKRAGKKEELKIMLPYSAMSFSVPKNLYIIGTMNTADRSVEALDTALRRRFSFMHMPSRPELLSANRLVWQLWWAYEDRPWTDGEFLKKEQSLYQFLGATALLAMTEAQKEVIWNKMTLQRHDESVFDHTFSGFDLVTFLTKINLRLESLLSVDHAIGHSYFMAVYSREDLMDVLYDKVIPLLQEYFYGDLGKIGLVLGPGFIRIRKNEGKDLFAYFNYDTDTLSEKEIYEMLDYRENSSYELKINKKYLTVDFDRAVSFLLGEKPVADE